MITKLEPHMERNAEQIAAVFSVSSASESNPMINAPVLELFVNVAFSIKASTQPSLLRMSIEL